MTNWRNGVMSKNVEQAWREAIREAIGDKKEKELKALLVRLDTLLFRIDTLYNVHQLTTEQYFDAVADWLDLLEDGVNSV